MNAYLLIPVVLTAYFGTINTAIGGTYELTRNAAISGHNTRPLSNVSVRSCQAACDKQSWCKSFDYYKGKKRCDLSNKRASDVGGLKTNYSGNPYDHYQKKGGGNTQATTGTGDGLNCKAKIKGTARSITKGSAKKMARAIWRAKVIKNHGVSYAVWSSSIKKSNSCKSKLGIKRCTVRATPCKSSLKTVASKAVSHTLKDSKKAYNYYKTNKPF